MTISGKLSGGQFGVDVSSHNGNIYWPAVNLAGATFAFVRATFGASQQYGGQGNYLDVNLTQNVQGAINNQIIVGVYHVANLTNNSPLSEALTFLSEAGRYAGDGYLPPILDIEATNADAYFNQNGGGAAGMAALSLWVSNWLQTVASYTGVTPGIYTSQSVLLNDLNTNLASNYPLWIATYSGNPTGTPSYGGRSWPNWVFQQWSKTGTCPGISGQVDFDSFNGSPNSLFISTSHPSANNSVRFLTAPGGGTVQPPHNGQFQLGIFAPGRQTITVQSTADFVNWSDASRLSVVGGTAIFSDTAGGSKSQSFYRLQP